MRRHLHRDNHGEKDAVITHAKQNWHTDMDSPGKSEKCIAARLLKISKSEYNDGAPVIKVSQELLGDIIGVIHKTINQHLSAFEQDSLIRVGYGRIELLDLSGLDVIASAWKFPKHGDT